MIFGAETASNRDGERKRQSERERERGGFADRGGECAYCMHPRRTREIENGEEHGDATYEAAEAASEDITKL